ncbi:MAG: dTDP-4-dehydrorhamnose reductase [Methylophilaceae bacterium]
MNPRRILLTGVNGQVGHALLPLQSEFQIIALTRNQLDLSNIDAIRTTVREIKPDLIINPAAYTAVDKAETEPELAYAINAVAPQILAEEAAKLDAALIHFSTDYVYDGSKQFPYVEDDAVNPINTYGKSKLAGENAIKAIGSSHLILRTSWAYGVYGANFLKTILRLASERDRLNIVANKYGAPTSIMDIAEAVGNIIESWQPKLENQSGIFHITNSGRTSWHGFACEIVKEYNRLSKVPALKTNLNNIEAINSADYPMPAKRPANSRLDNGKLKLAFGLELPSWQQSLQQVMQHL